MAGSDDAIGGRNDLRDRSIPVTGGLIQSRTLRWGEGCRRNPYTGVRSCEEPQPYFWRRHYNQFVVALRGAPSPRRAS